MYYQNSDSLPFRVAVRKPKRVNESAKRDFERVKEGTMKMATARRRDAIRIRTAAIAREM